MIRVYLDTVEYKVIDDLDKFQEVLERDDSFGGLVPKFPKNIIFYDLAYDFLYDKFIQDGYCSQVAIRMTNECDGSITEILNGHIILADIKWDFDKCGADCPIVDDSAISFIFANKDLKVPLSATTSKNGTTLSISNVINTFTLTMHNPADGITDSGFLAPGLRYMSDARDVINFIIAYITNQAIIFESDFFDNLALDEKIALTGGQEFRLGIPPPFDIAYLSVSFNDLFSSLRKLYNVGFVIIRQYGITKFKLETEADLHKITTAISLNKVPGIKQKTVTGRIYSSVDSGDSKAVVFDGTICAGSPQHSVPIDTYLDFQKNNYIIDSICNISKKYNLVNDDFVIDSNIIEQLLIGVCDDNGARKLDNSFDDDLFLIQYDKTSGVEPFLATQGTYVPLKFPYNEQLINKNIINRFGYTDNPDVNQVANNVILDREKDMIIQISFEFPVSDQDWQILKATPHFSLLVSNEKKSFIVWINKFSRNVSTSLCECECITNLKFS